MKSIVFNFLKFYKVFKESFETPLNDYIWLAELGEIYVTLFYGGSQQKLSETIKESISRNAETSEFVKGKSMVREPASKSEKSLHVSNNFFQNQTQPTVHV